MVGTLNICGCKKTKSWQSNRLNFLGGASESHFAEKGASFKQCPGLSFFENNVKNSFTTEPAGTSLALSWRVKLQEQFQKLHFVLLAMELKLLKWSGPSGY